MNRAVVVLAEIASERRRQGAAEGWSLAHDDGHTRGELADAAACYAHFAAAGSVVRDAVIAEGPQTDVMFLRQWWPWARRWWKPKDRRRDLVRAAALIVAEIERLDRLAAKGGAK